MIANRGLRHLALKVSNVERAREFYVRVFGMKEVWRPDPDNAYLSSGCDNLALHRAADGERGQQSLDHLGFVVATVEELEAGFRYASESHLDIAAPLRRHRDGSVSFYLRDPDGNLVQALFEPNISPLTIGHDKGTR